MHSKEALICIIQLSLLRNNVLALFNKTHTLLFYDDKRGENVSLFEAVKNRLDRLDLFYGILGRPRDDTATKQHLDSFTALDNLLQQFNLNAKASLLNTDIADHWQQQQHPSLHEPDQQNSYWAKGEWLEDYGRRQLGLEWSIPTDSQNANFDSLGFIAHSWPDCISSWQTQTTTCIHILQIRNLRGFYPGKIKIYEMTPLFDWIKRQMGRYKEEKDENTQIVVVFQAIEDGYEQILDQFKPGGMLSVSEQSINLMAILFTLNFNPVKFQRKLCLSDKVQVPIINMGGELNKSYALLHFTRFSRGLKYLYIFSVHNSTLTIAYDINLSDLHCL